MATTRLSRGATETIEAFAGTCVLCVGDVMLDVFINGGVKRISPERPVPVFNFLGRQDVAGGAANVARNIASLGGMCTLVGVVGEDAAAVTLADAATEGGGIAADLVPTASRPTTEKTRFVSQGNHLLRVDVENAAPIDASTADAVVDAVMRELPSVGVVVLSDYAKGVLTDDVLYRVIAAARNRGVPIVVDPKSNDLSRYAGATVVTPNSSEMQAMTGVDTHEDELAAEAGRSALADTTIDALLITRSQRGMTLVERDAGTLHIPTMARAVYDVVGAGDTVVAALALALGAGFGLADSAIIANAAAGVVVGKPGTATVTPDELRDELSVAIAGRRPTGAPVMLTRSAVADFVASARAGGRRVGFTNGIFDIIQPAHVQLLEFARAHCDRLIVGLNSDDSAYEILGDAHPVNTADNRALLLAALGSVDAVVIFDEASPEALLATVRPDVFIEGGHPGDADVVGADVVRRYGGDVIRSPKVER